MKTLSFEGSTREYFKIWIVNVLLVIVTLGLYYPWAKVRNHRYFYANTTFDDRNFEYHATGKQLFIGYLIAMGLFIAYMVMQNISPIGSLVLFGVFVIAFPWIIWRSLKFNLLMTSFSNVRFSFAGKIGNAYLNYLLLPIAFFGVLYGVPILSAIVLTKVDIEFTGLTRSLAVLGGFLVVVLAFYLFAYMKKRNTCYAVNGFRYGQGEFKTSVEVGGFAKILLKTMVIGIGVMVLLLIVISIGSAVTMGTAAFTSAFDNLENPEAWMDRSVIVVIALLYIAMIAASFLIMAYSYARQRRYIFKNSRLDHNIAFNSTLGARTTAWVMVSNFVAILLSLGLAFPWAKVRMARLVLGHTFIDSDVEFDQYISQAQGDQSPIADQIGDAFDVDVGVGI